MKSIFHTIVTLIILPLMVFSYSGLKVHYHFCGKSGEVFSSVMIAGVAESGAVECICSHQEPSCCSKGTEGGATSCHEPDNKACCSDHITAMQTDVHFPATHYFVSLIAPPVFSIAEGVIPKETEKIISQVQITYSPPNQAFLSVFRL